MMFRSDFYASAASLSGFWRNATDNNNNDALGSSQSQTTYTAIVDRKNVTRVTSGLQRCTGTTGK